MKNLGSLKQVDLREMWRKEEYDFTPWLMRDDNISLLADELGIELSVIDAEAKTGKYSVDILAQEENTGRKIIIENQLEKTNHDHLGKIITYASGFDAEYIVWIVKEANEEHRQALEWLNEHTDNQLNFFLIQLELWQIEDSPYAVKLNTIVKPNEWTKTLREQSRSKDLSDTKLLQLEFWKEFKNYCKEHDAKFRTRKPLPQHWYDISIGRSNANVAMTVNTVENLITCDLYIPDDKDLYDEFYQEIETIEQRIDQELQWQRLDDKKASRIRLIRNGDLEKEQSWPQYFEWMMAEAEQFKAIFGA